MAYKTLLTILNSPETGERRIAAASKLAASLDAHLEVLCLGIDIVQIGYYFAGADAIVQQNSIEQARGRAKEVEAQAKKLLAGSTIRWSTHGIVAQYGALNDLVAQYARYADLVVLPKPYGDTATPEHEPILEAALFSGNAPVLVLPDDGIPEDFGKRAVIGWNEGAEALNAVRAALPALKATERTSIAIIDPPKHAPEQTGPGHALSTMLDRHGVKAEIALLPKTTPRVADVLMQHVNDTNATLLVAGAYGHSRFRQAILGGATRDLLTSTTVPVLMAH
ncbi:universal stress protein [Qingshengfaniella alkalisoli]|uniref:Universal stress protein n=1 Tax=Qingshengfaniella alkalisoli TaxID=2599296 RepID=A0A5B8IT57_9RHOB|nr:universal stress protein [Qingshengfaniella alkalisoli]QDY68633.1 universal stress protein [Qingshengfaniella alkalisoli]